MVRVSGVPSETDARSDDVLHRSVRFTSPTPPYSSMTAFSLNSFYSTPYEEQSYLCMLVD